ncbi:MAG: hypothetical protein L3J39_14365 [Verrucomicrobiales bacterium]|nr:hypothetical protein [Verrucomicrobiales bacterium]
MKTKNILQYSAALATGFLLTGHAIAGPIEVLEKNPVAEVEEVDPFAKAIKPMSNPTLFDLALPRTTIRPIFMTQSLPSRINTMVGEVPLGGDMQLYALQLEYAFNNRLSFVATKDGYIDFNPDSTLSGDNGWANLAAGLKYAVLYNPESQHVMSISAIVEVPTGNTGVFQGTGDGALNLVLSDVKLLGRWQFAGAIGAHIPFNTGAESTTGFVSGHVSYWLTDWFAPLVEVNWYRVLNEGNGGNRFASQLGGAVPAVAQFEGGDLINLGASNAGVNGDIVTAAAGFRIKLTDNVHLGAAYELPVTDVQDNLMKNRITVDMTITF